ncbi:hypothetical protein llap_11223 [Limosa lapponica baueri]|uniref:Uncharacterized protein n=1 Tax=Limosa lapponica baueri TaxID=1758121 RepID=A0A2I0TXD0_LIMLA|nr:hypothetical protein llap_11223 [Limosa lapponica baueri]
MASPFWSWLKLAVSNMEAAPNLFSQKPTLHTHCLTTKTLPLYIDTGDYPDLGAGLGLVGLHEVHMGPPLKPVKVLLTASLPSSESTALLSLVSSANLLRMHSNLTVYVIDEDIKWYLSQFGPLRDITCFTGHWTTNDNALDTTIQPLPYPSIIPSIKPISLQFSGKDVVGDCI